MSLKKYNETLQTVCMFVTKNFSSINVSVRVNNIVTCGSNSRHMNFQRHKADDPATLECEVTVTPVWCVCLSSFACGDSVKKFERK